MSAATSTLMGFVHRRRRGAELFLLLLSLVVGVGGYVAVGLGVKGEVPTDILGYGTWLAVLIVIAHIVVRIKAPYADPVLLPVVAALNGLGLAVIKRLGMANPNLSSPSTQLMWMTIGVLLFCATLFVVRDHRLLQRFTYTFGLAAIVLLIMPLLPGIGMNKNGARIWIHVGSMSFQPGEVAKVLLVLTFAGYLTMHKDALALAGRRFLFIDLPRGRDLFPILMMWLVGIGILVLQKDLGSAVLFFGLFTVMVYVATERPGWLAVAGLLALLAGVAVWLVISSGATFLDHVQTRVDTWLHPMEYFGAQSGPNSDQLVNGQFGMAWGGMLGRGFGEGMPYLTPLADSDFIIASIGEELGLTGVMAVLLMYVLIVERAMRTALISRDPYGKLIAVGLGSAIALQVFVVVGGVTRLIPLTGLTTPFLAAGGSSLVANWVIIALLMRISDQARRPVPVLTDTQASEALDADQTQVVKL